MTAGAQTPIACKNLKLRSCQIDSLKAMPAEAIEKITSPAAKVFLLPNLSLANPQRNCPTAMPTKNTLRESAICCGPVENADSSSLKAGKYISVATNPNIDRQMR